MNKNFFKILISVIVLVLSYSSASAKNLYFEEGKKLFKNKNFKDSKFYFEKDIVFNPKNENSYLYLAKIFNEDKNDILEERRQENNPEPRQRKAIPSRRPISSQQQKRNLKVGRNDPCPCGSGKKYKQCHG